MDVPSFNPDEVRAAIHASKNSNACGLDGCSSKYLKLFPELCTPLCDIFNMSIKQRALPSTWKLAHIVPIYKGKGSKLNVVNYRPISLTNVFCKLMETLIRTKIVKFLDANNLISPYQSGFRHGRSNLSQLLLASNALVKCVDDRARVDSVYTDLS